MLALGACAAIGGINKLKNNFDLDDVKKCVYGNDATRPHLHTEMTKAVDEIVEVDYKIHGCPIEAKDFTTVIRALLIDKKPETPEYPVCVECKAKGNPPEIIDQGQDAVRQKLEMLVRSYDPCVSCSTHMLDIQFVK